MTDAIIIALPVIVTLVLFIGSVYNQSDAKKRLEESRRNVAAATRILAHAKKINDEARVSLDRQLKACTPLRVVKSEPRPR